MPSEYSNVDKLIIEFDKALTTLFGAPETSNRVSPDSNISDDELTEKERKNSIALMRVNHSGEVAAQALYQGQALTAKLPNVKRSMEEAAIEENDHLVWCDKRIQSLGGRTSLLNPLWYTGSFALGALAGKIGDKWSLGFVAETETQVVSHIDSHLASLSVKDKRSRVILEQMRLDESHHKDQAIQAGGANLPKPVKSLMGKVSKVMTKTSLLI